MRLPAAVFPVLVLLKVTSVEGDAHMVSTPESVGNGQVVQVCLDLVLHSRASSGRSGFLTKQCCLCLDGSLPAGQLARSAEPNCC